MSTVVVTTVHGRHEHLVRQAASLRAATRRTLRWVVVAMADPEVADVLAPHAGGLDIDVVDVPDADPTALPLARARNLGARRALERGAATLVFLDVDCLAGPDLVGGYERVVRRHPGTIWSGPVTYLPPGLGAEDLARPWLHDDPHPARPAPRPGRLVHQAPPELFWSLSFALSAEAWLTTGGFCEEYVGYGAEDTDFGLLARAAGLELGWVGDARAYHQHHGSGGSPAREHAADIVANGAVFARRWGRWPMEGWLAELEEAGVVARDGSGWRLVRTTACTGTQRVPDRPDTLTHQEEA